MSQGIRNSLIDVLILEEELVGNGIVRGSRHTASSLAVLGRLNATHPVSPLHCYAHLSMCDLSVLAILVFFLPVHSLPDHK